MASHILAGVAINVLLAFFLINVVVKKVLNISFFDNKFFEAVVQFVNMMFNNY